MIELDSLVGRMVQLEKEFLELRLSNAELKLEYEELKKEYDAYRTGHRDIAGSQNDSSSSH